MRSDFKDPTLINTDQIRAWRQGQIRAYEREVLRRIRLQRFGRALLVVLLVSGPLAAAAVVLPAFLAWWNR